MNNMKVGCWDIMYCKYNEQEYQQMEILMNLQEIFQIYNYSGGGFYDQEGNQKKIGMWEVLFEVFRYDAQITYIGKYNMNNVKVGRWDIMYCDPYGDGKYKQMQIMNLQEYLKLLLFIYSGGRSFDQEGNQKKIRKWVELDDRFEYYSQVTYNGEYNIKGQKVGIWIEIDKEENKKRGEKLMLIDRMRNEKYNKNTFNIIFTLTIAEFNKNLRISTVI